MKGLSRIQAIARIIEGGLNGLEDSEMIRRFLQESRRLDSLSDQELETECGRVIGELVRIVKVEV
jgi:hypothetical protein